MVPFTRKYKLDHLGAIRWHGMEIRRGIEVKYLGMTLDQKLLWTHLGSICKKATRVLMIYKFVVGKQGGCTPKTLCLINTAILRSVTTYGAMIWSDCLQHDSQGVGKEGNLRNVRRSATLIEKRLTLFLGGIPSYWSRIINSLAMRLNFDKEFETRRSNRADWESGAGT